MRGYDWVTHQGDPEPADSDMDFTGALPPAVETNVDRFDLVEGLSGYEFDDILRGDDRAVADLTAGANEPADSHVLDPAGIARITGLASVLPAGTTRFDTGNIIIGGGGADLIEGRGGDDVIDGDAQLTVELRVPYKDGFTVRTVESLSEIRADALAGLIDPGGITIIRRIERPVATGVVDTAVFSGPEADYDVTVNADGTTTVDHARGTQADGVDTLRNIEVLQFAANPAPTVTAQTPAVNATGVAVGNDITATFSEGVQGVTNTTFFVRSNAAPNTAIAATVTQGAGNQWILNPTANLAAGTAYTVTLTGGAAAIRDLQNAPLATTTWSFTTAAAPAAIVAARTPAVNATNVVTNTNVTATFSLNVAGVNGTTFTLRRVSNNTLVAAGVTYNATTRTATLNPNANLVAGVQYRATLTGGAAAIRVAPNGTPLTTTSWTFTTDGTAPTVFTGAGTLTNPLAGATGFSRTANVVTEFSEPMVLGGITATTVRLQRVSTGAIVTAVVTSANLNGRTRAILNPGVTLVANAQYRVLLTGGATALRDLSGNPLATQNRTFTTGA
jgi:hypothetical protein